MRLLRGHSGFTLIELLVVVAIIGILAAMLFPVFANAREKSRQTQCMSNQRQIWMAITLFAQDNNEIFPSATQVWSQTNLSPKVLHCLTDINPTSTNSYVFNANLSALPLARISDTSLVVTDGVGGVTISYNDSDIALRHLGKAAVCWGDGHLSLEAFPSFTAPMIDMMGRTLKFSHNIQRIILTRGRDVYELGALLGTNLPSELVAWGSDIQANDLDCYNQYTTTFPTLKNIPLLTSIQSGYQAADIEQMVMLKPDLVIVDKGFYNNPGVSTLLMNSGLPVLFDDLTSNPLTAPQQSVLLLGNVLGVEPRAAQMVNAANTQINLVNARIGAAGGGLTAYLEAGNGGPSTFATTYSSDSAGMQNGSWGSMLAQCKITSSMNGFLPTGMGTFSQQPEQVLASNPGVIIITGANWPASGTMRLGYGANLATAQGTLQGYLTRAGWNNLPAVQNKKVYSVFHGDTMHIFDFVAYEQLAQWCYPNLFSDLNPPADWQTFHNAYMPVPFSGTWMCSLP